MAGLGLIGTWSCYLVMGNAWAISQNKKQTHKLVQSGPYRWVRHPIYVFQWVILFGLFLHSPAWPLLASLAILSLCMFPKSKSEEKGLEEIFGHAYEDYRRKVGRFVPRW